jgi:3-oxoacyl-[acyl-carrier-protein] synthase-3
LYKARISGIGCYVPPRVLTNYDLERMVDTTNEWILERTGISERHIADPDMATSDLAVEAAKNALERAGLAASDIDAILVCTVTPDHLFPATACLVQHRLGATKAWGFDLVAACSGFVYGLTTAAHLVMAGTHQRVLVIGADTMSRILDYTDRKTCILFGDGAGAAVLEPVEEGGFVGFELGADGSGAEDLFIPAGGSRVPTTAESVAGDLHAIRMRGQEVFRFATRIMVTSADNLLAECGATVADVDLYVPHQANKRIIDHAAKNLGLDREKVFLNIERYGNTSAASVPLCLADADAAGLLRPGTRVLMSAVGGGFTWGSAYMTWTGQNGA